MKLSSILFLLLTSTLMPSLVFGNQTEQQQLTNIAAKLASMLPAGNQLIANPSVTNLYGYGEKTQVGVTNNSSAIGGLQAEIVTKKGRNHWDGGANIKLFKPVKKGDVLHLTFFAKVIEASDDTGALHGVGVQLSQPPYSALFSNQVQLTKEWQSFSFAGRAPQDFTEDQLQASFQVASQAQTVAIGPVFVFNVGEQQDIGSLPFIK